MSLHSALFDRPPLVETDSLAHAEDVYARFNTPIRIDRKRSSSAFSWRAHLVSVGGFDISVHRYGGGFSAGTDEFGDIYSYSIPLGHAASEAVVAGTSIALAADTAGVITSPGQPGMVRFGDGHVSMQVKFARAELDAAFAGLAGPSRGGKPKRIAFAPRLALDSGAGASLRRFSSYIADEAARDDGALSSPVVAARLADTLLHTLLLGLVHDGTPELEASSTPAEPEHVRLAADYLDAHATRPVRMAELATVTGMSLRAIQLAFQRHRGCTPTEFLLARRLVAAHAALLATPHVPITRIALDHGFGHLGRFSAFYRARFGETPSRARARVR